MKKNILLPSIIVSGIIACTIFVSDGLTYLVTSIMALAIMGIIHRNRSWVMKMTRWSKANPHKAQVLITVLQIVIMALGIFGGYNLKKLGYELSNTSAFVFSTIIVTGFLSVNFLPKRGSIAIPAEVNKNRLVYMGIALSSFVMMVFIGNGIEDKYPNSSITHTIKAIDEAIFSDNNSLYTEQNDIAPNMLPRDNYVQNLKYAASSMAVFASFSVNEKETIVLPPNYSKKETRAKLKAEKNAKRLENKKARKINVLLMKRLAVAAGISAGAVLLLILLIGTLCAGVCLLIAGLSGSGAGYAIAGVVVTAGSVWGIIKIAKGKKENKTEP